MKHLVRPPARDDILRLFRYYLLQGASDAAFGFLDAVEASIETIRGMPEIGAPKPLRNPALAGLRSWPVKDFDDMLIYYLVTDQAVRVIRVLHGKRDVKTILERERPASDEEVIQ